MVVLASTALVTVTLSGQDRLSSMPGHAQFATMQEQLRAQPAYVSGAIDADWSDDSASFTYTQTMCTLTASPG
jgi:hypothetical protein